MFILSGDEPAEGLGLTLVRRKIKMRERLWLELPGLIVEKEACIWSHMPVCRSLCKDRGVWGTDMNL